MTTASWSRSVRATALMIVLAITLMLITAVPAFAAKGDSDYLDWSVVSTLPANGGATSPHGAYATTTVKCGVCHAVHNATSGGEILLPAPVADACAYCHMNSAVGYVQVYGGDSNNYSGTDYDNAHNEFEVAGVQQGVTCVMCHQVHAADSAMTRNPLLTQKLLKGPKDPIPPFNPTNADPVAGVPQAGDSKDVALTKWCAGCHFTLGVGYGYYEDQYNSYTHIMGTANASYANSSATYSGRVAWEDSTYCHSCHANEYGVAGRWPHMTNGARFLESGAGASLSSTGAASSSEDGVCLRCHTDDGTDGIGNDF